MFYNNDNQSLEDKQISLPPFWPWR